MCKKGVGERERREGICTTLLNFAVFLGFTPAPSGIRYPPPTSRTAEHPETRHRSRKELDRRRAARDKSALQAMFHAI